MYKERFETIFRVARKITSSFDIGDILETIREEALTAVPELQEVCLLVTEPDAQDHMRPLQCSQETENIKCRLCERGWPTVPSEQATTSDTACCGPSEDGGGQSALDETAESLSEVLLPIYDGDKPFAYLDAIAKEGAGLGKKDRILLKDLADMATNVIISAQEHRRITQEKLALNRILEHLRPFVPATVQRIVETNPDAPPLEKKEVDVSILFLDIADYTRISETYTKEKVNSIMERYFSGFLDEIYAHGGDINETAGDGLMVIFQGAAADNALNAVRAALAIRRRTSDINAELQNSFESIEVNMGINSGIAAVGMSRFQGTAGVRMTFTAAGPVTNLAARIASAAINGDVLIGPETATRIEKEISLHDRGVMNFKNIKDPVHVFSLIPS